MNVVIGLSVLYLICQMGYNFVLGLFAKRIYFRKPLQTSASVMEGDVFFFATTIEKIKKFFAPLVAMGILIFIAIISESPYIFFVMIGPPIILVSYWFTRLFRVSIFSDCISFKASPKKDEQRIKLEGITQIELRYEYSNNIVEPTLVFQSSTETIEVPLPRVYFLKKSVEILMTLKHRYPDKTILLKWSLPKKNNNEVIEIQKGTVHNMPMENRIATVQNSLAIEPTVGLVAGKRKIGFKELMWSCATIGICFYIFIPSLLGILCSAFIVFGIIVTISGNIGGYIEGIKARLIGIIILALGYVLLATVAIPSM